MDYNEKIMLAVCKRFLSMKPEHMMDKEAMNLYIPKFLADLPNVPPDTIRWHIAVLFDEFVIKQDICTGVFGNWRFRELENVSCHLNRSGQKLYADLKQKYPQE